LFIYLSASRAGHGINGNFIIPEYIVINLTVVGIKIYGIRTINKSIISETTFLPLSIRTPFSAPSSIQFSMHMLSQDSPIKYIQLTALAAIICSSLMRMLLFSKARRAKIIYIALNYRLITLSIGSKCDTIGVIFIFDSLENSSPFL